MNAERDTISEEDYQAHNFDRSKLPVYPPADDLPILKLIQVVSNDSKFAHKSRDDVAEHDARDIKKKAKRENCTKTLAGQSNR